MPVRSGLALAVAALAASPASAERFSNPTVGISIDKPSGWQVLTAAANADNLKKAEIGTPEFQAAIQRYASVPLYAFMKHAEPFADVNPSVKINTRPVGPFAGKSGQQVLEMIVPNLSKVMADFKIVAAPYTTTLAGRAAGHAVMDYTLKSGGAAYPARSEMWIVPRGDHIVIVGVGLRQDEKTGSRAEIGKILESIVIEG
jgi:hypothetical protein